MKIHQNFFRALAIAGLSLSMAAAQSTGTPGNTGSSSQNTGQNTDLEKMKGTDRNRTGDQSSNSTSAAGQTATAGEHNGHVAGAAGNSQAGTGDLIGPSDRQFMMKAAQGGMMEVQVAQMAQQKAASSEVKEFAQKLEQDHSKANDQLKKIAEERGVQLPGDIGDHQKQLAKLQNLSGEEFDRAFMKMQVQHHKKDISEFRKQQNRSMDTSVKDFAAAQLPVLQQHYERAQQISSSTGTRSRKADRTDMNHSSESNTSNKGTGSPNQ